MKIAVLCGGYSTERDVSIKSGAMIAKALRENGHSVALIDEYLGCRKPYKSPDDIYTSSGGEDGAEITSSVPDLDALERSREWQTDGSRIGYNVVEICRAADIVFLALHGSDGEDGRLQALLDIHGIRYTGSGYLGSAIAMNKQTAKELFKANGIRTPEGKVINIADRDRSFPCLPCVVKPRSSGSSVGTSIVRSPDEYGAALEFGFRYDDFLIVERYIEGREVDVGVLSGRALPPIEIKVGSGFFDYKNKYQPGMTEEICPTDLPEKTIEALERAAESVFGALCLDVYARMDFIVDNDGLVWCLEANTLPGMTPASLLPKEAAAAGIDYNRLCETIVTESLRKYAANRI